MNFYSKTFLTVSIFLAILFINCQTYENKGSNEDSTLISLKLNDKLHYSKNIEEGDSKFSLISGYVENKDQQKRQFSVKKKIAKPKKPPTSRPTTRRKVTTTIPKKPSTSRPTTTRKVTTTKPKKPLYRDINTLREKYFMPKLKVNVTRSKELQKYVERFVKGDQTFKPLPPVPEDLIYFTRKGEKYDPIEFWSKDEHLLTYENIYDDLIDLFYTKLIWKSSKYIGCGVYGNVNGIFTFCKITPRGNIKGQYDENVFNRG
uniref:SCP domain-containing protein n=1 Tax=Strongyloides papillosus TaxID=174720 RepID=A0A0N5CAZ2_STREA